MSNEIRRSDSLQISRSGVLTFRSSVTAYNENQVNAGGPTPGYLNIEAGFPVDVDLSELVLPARCEISNVDTSNYCTVGVFDPTTGKFYPFMELLPRTKDNIRLSRFLLQELAGTGTHEDHVTTLRIEPGRGAGVKVVVNAFEA